MIFEMQEYYRERAKIYNASMGYDRPETLTTLLPILQMLRNRLAGRSVLEIACGPGFWTQQIADAAQSILAMDYNETTLVETRKKNLGPKVQFRRADAYALPRFEQSFQACFACDWWCHVPRSKRQEFLAGAHACLSPGALVIFCDQFPKVNSPTVNMDLEGNNLQTRTLPDGRSFVVIKNFPTKIEMEKLLSPFTHQIEFTEFPEAGRYLLMYQLKP
jgi:ubiquinone/menaquinone biosynthesis C-methylase UbiE